MRHPLNPIPVWRNVDAALFCEEILPANRPAVLKGLVETWPAVRAGLRAPRALADYLASFASPNPAKVLIGDPSIKGKFFYTPDMRGFNFATEHRSIIQILDQLMGQADDPNPVSMAAQATDVPTFLPGFQTHNAISLVAPSISPRIWIGNAIEVAAHFDFNDNIACVVGGRRVFTLFPPDQVRNLYTGPIELTPAGVPISLVDFDAPDLERHPRFAQALEAAEVAELEPGDAIYIPALWWHHVRSLDPLSVLANYWWNVAEPEVGSPFELLLLALISLRDLPPANREAWRALFDHWVFRDDGDPAAHMPVESRGFLSQSTPALRRHVRAMAARVLSGG